MSSLLRRTPSGGRSASIRSAVSRLSLTGDAIRRASANTTTNTVNTAGGGGSEDAGSAAGGPNTAAHTSVNTAANNWRRVSNASGVPGLGDDDVHDEAFTEAQLDEEDALAAPAADLHVLLHKAVDGVVILRRALDNYTHDMTTRLRERGPRRSSDTDGVFEEDSSHEDGTTHVKRQVTEVEHHVLLAVDLSKRVQRGMEIKTAATTKAKSRATEQSGQLEVMKKEVEAARAVVVQKDEMISAKEEELKEQAEKANVRANAEREWWEQKLKEAQRLTDKIKEECEMELQYAMENAAQISSNNEAQFKERIATLEGALHKVTMDHAKQTKEMKEGYIRQIRNLEGEFARARAKYEADYEKLQEDYFAFVAEHEEGVAKHKAEVDTLLEQAAGMKDEIESLGSLYRETEELATRIAAEKEELEKAQAADTARLEELTTLLDETESQLEELRAAAAEKEAQLTEQLNELQEELAKVKKANDFTKIRGMCIDAIGRYVHQSWMRVAWARLDRYRIYSVGARRVREIEAAVKDIKVQLGAVQDMLQVKERELEESNAQMEAAAEAHAAERKQAEEAREKTEHSLRLKIEELRTEVDKQTAAVAAWVKRHREEELERERIRQREKSVRSKKSDDTSKMALEFLGEYRSLIEFLVRKHRMKKFNMEMLELPPDDAADYNGNDAENAEKRKRKIDGTVFKIATSVARLFSRMLDVERRLRYIRVRTNVTTVWDRIKLRREKRLEKRRHVCPQSAELCRQQILYLQARINLRESVMHASLAKSRQIFTEGDFIDEDQTIKFAAAQENEVRALMHQCEQDLDRLAFQASLQVSHTVWALIQGGVYVYPDVRGNQQPYAVPPQTTGGLLAGLGSPRMAPRGAALSSSPMLRPTSPTTGRHAPDALGPLGFGLSCIGARMSMRSPTSANAVMPLFPASPTSPIHPQMSTAPATLAATSVRSTGAAAAAALSPPTPHPAPPTPMQPTVVNAGVGSINALQGTRIPSPQHRDVLLGGGVRGGAGAPLPQQQKDPPQHHVAAGAATAAGSPNSQGKRFYTTLTAGAPCASRMHPPPQPFSAVGRSSAGLAVEAAYAQGLSAGGGAAPSPLSALRNQYHRSSSPNVLREQLARTAPAGVGSRGPVVGGVNPRESQLPLVLNGHQTGPQFSIGPMGATFPAGSSSLSTSAPIGGSPPPHLPPRAATAAHRASRAGVTQLKFDDAAVNPVVVKDARPKSTNHLRKRDSVSSPLASLLHQAPPTRPNSGSAAQETAALILQGVQTLPHATGIRVKSPPPKVQEAFATPPRPASAVVKKYASKPTPAPLLSIQGGSAL